MSVITVNGAATSYDLPQYVGELFQKGKRPNTFLRLIGGLTGALRTVASTEFPMGVDYEIPSGTQPAILEGAAPTASEYGTGQSSNVVQIFQEAVELTYTRQATTGTLSGVATIPGVAGHGELQTPGTLDWQIARKMEKIQNDANVSFLNGAYQKPGSNATARKTRGALTAVTTNLFANGGTGRPVSKSIITAALKDMVANTAFMQGEEVFMLADAAQYGAIAALYAGDTRLPESREVAGVAINKIITDWGVINLVYEPDMPSGKVFITQPKFCRVVALPIPDKGLLFVEPLAKSGSSEKYQVYGELGIDYLNEVKHGVIADLS